MIVYKKPSVNAKGYRWELMDIGRSTFGYTGADVEVYQQRATSAEEPYGSFVDHYRLRAGGKWVRKTFFGETAWMDVTRFAGDEYGVAITV